MSSLEHQYASLDPIRAFNHARDFGPDLDLHIFMVWAVILSSTIFGRFWFYGVGKKCILIFY